MLDADLTDQLRAHFAKITEPVVLAAALGDDERSTELWRLLTQLAELSDTITAERRDHERRPSFLVERAGTDIGVRFGGIPLGHELTSLVLAILQVGGHPSTADPDTLDRVRAIDRDLEFETYFSVTCQNCPDVVQALNLMSIVNPRIRHTAIDGAAFPDEVESRKVMAVPTVFLDGEMFDQGRMTLDQIVDRLDLGAAQRRADELNAADPFDVLVVGGGPAGAAAAVYAARKGIRTGVAAERFGGQVLDTVAIENLISVPHTEGPKLAAALEAHVNSYDVDVMDRLTAVGLDTTDDGFAIRFSNGATLRAHTVVVSTGARWRSMNVPGEAEYRNKGVTYCPHCDGPLFAGKRVAVIGGGNSGIEAAIDLAGVVAHVTVVEFDDRLRADDVLQRKLRSLDNVDVITSAATTEVIGDGDSVTAIRYSDRRDGTEHELELDGIFVQIGLLPNTEWLSSTLELSGRGEVVIDERGATSLPGVFAAGDCTTVPYKQIVVALGAGATAALSAFDHLIRTTAPPAETTAPTEDQAAGPTGSLAAAG